MTSRFPHVSLSVVLPAYNEEANIRTTISRAVPSLRGMVGEFEIIVIDDCSRDRTLDVALELAAHHRELRVIRNETNLRQGGCLQKGFALAQYDYITHNAMDYPFDFEDLPVLLSQFPAADVVVAARRTYPGVSRPRRFVSWTNRKLLDVLFGAGIHDYNFIQIYKRHVLQGQPSFSTATSFITPEKIIRAHRAGQKVIEVEVEYHRRESGKPSSANLKNVRRALHDMGQLWIELNWRSKRGRPST